MTRLYSITAIFLLAMIHLALGQEAGPARSESSPVTRKKDLEEATEKLKQAKETMDLEKARAAAESVLEKLPPKVGDTARDALESSEERGKLMDAARSAAGTLLPEAKKLLRRDEAPATEVAPAGVPAADQPPAAVGPAPQPLPALNGSAPAMGKNSVIIESDDATADLKNAIFIYSGRVRARHPQFYIECEELEVHMVKEDDMPEKKTPAANDPIAPAGDRGGADSRIKMAVARGPMVTIEKLTETGEIQQGKCKRAVYRGATGEIVMSDYPQVQRGNVLHIATDPSTEMTFDPKGKLHTSGGRQRTIVLPADSTQSPSPAGSGINRKFNDQ